MNKPDFVYLLVAIAFGIQQAYWWAKLIQWRRHVLYPTPILLWSLFFIGHLYTSFSPPPEDLLTLSFIGFFFLYFITGFLLFPRIEGLDYKSPYTYIDVYEELCQKRCWVFGTALLAQGVLLYTSKRTGQVLMIKDLVVPCLLLAAFLTEHKGLMLLWVWIGLSWLFFGAEWN